ncbi:36325_t:CDS:1 [Gigaspora margarita]|uniref:36325_t:CDS:1 n=1 Tax=Gigaspora margarita TaxID=4874 RepID=A0ABM8VVM6_GIGMA|nr:36325_t:CDS:1 [Gigaspora margarita]
MSQENTNVKDYMPIENQDYDFEKAFNYYFINIANTSNKFVRIDQDVGNGIKQITFDKDKKIYVFMHHIENVLSLNLIINLFEKEPIQIMVSPKSFKFIYENETKINNRDVLNLVKNLSKLPLYLQYFKRTQ